MKNIPIISRAEFAAALATGRMFCWAALYERQDFRLDLGDGSPRPIREITTEPEHYHRAIGRK